MTRVILLQVLEPPSHRFDRGGLSMGPEFHAKWGWSRYSVWDWECICDQLSDRLIVLRRLP